MRTNRTSLSLAGLSLAGALSLTGCDGDDNRPAPAPTPTPSVQTVPPAPAHRDADNTGVNVRDRNENAPTAGMAGQSKNEVELAANIRKRLTDTTMSANAQNAKIVVQGSSVILRGPVKSQEEKDAVGRIAADIAGEANVTNELEVEANP